MGWLRMFPNETGSLLFVGNVTADRSIRTNSEVYKVISSAHIQPITTTLTEWCFKASKRLDRKEMEYSSIAKSVIRSQL